MKSFSLFILTLLFSLSAWADINLEPLLNKVTLNLQAEQWLTTKTALVNVSVNAAVADQSIDKIQLDVMQKLDDIAKGEWHIVSFNRQQDTSGLESIRIDAQARLPQTVLTGMRDKAKAISKPGETFTISDVQFVPSNEELQQANIALRNNLYEQAKAEIDTLNKTYPDQKYYLHTINFITTLPMLVPNVYMKTAVANVRPAPLSVGNKLTLQASVVLASEPDQLFQKIVKN